MPRRDVREELNVHTGLFVAGGDLPRLPSDPDVFFYGGELPAVKGDFILNKLDCAGNRSGRPGRRPERMLVGGAGWSWQSARAACIGEALERTHAFAFPQDGTVVASYEDRDLAQAWTSPAQWVLFHDEQHAHVDFPFEKFTAQTRCEWVLMRQLATGAAWWVPSEFVFLHPHTDGPHQLGPAVSTGLACANDFQTAVVRGAQEVIERDALMGAWWGRYRVEEYPASWIWQQLGEQLRFRVERPSIHYRFFYIDSPYSQGVTMVGLSAQTEGGFVFSVGSACRANRTASFQKSLLEAIQGLPYVRFLKQQPGVTQRKPSDPCRDFPDHAVYYSLFPDRLQQTLFADGNTERCMAPHDLPRDETTAEWVRRLGEQRPILFRNMTSPCMPFAQTGQCVAKVVIPGLQPMHGNDAFAWVGGPLWSPRTYAQFVAHPTHPFP